MKTKTNLLSHGASIDFDVPEIDVACSIFKALLHPVRLQIMESIHQRGNANVTYLIKKLKLEQSDVSLQLKVLKNAQLLKSKKEGRNNYYAIDYERISKIMFLSKQLAPVLSFKKDVVKEKPSVKERPSFSKKELVIIKMICDQKQNHDIAKKLKLSYRTVERYRNDVLKKMGVRNTAGLVVYAIQNGIYTLKSSV